MNDKKKVLTLRIIIIAVVVLLTVGIIYGVGRSFGFFKYIKKGEIVNIITIGEIGGNIEIEVLNTDDNALNLANAYPVYDSEGLESTPFEFNITNTTDNNYTYQISILNDEEKQSACVLDDGTTCPELTTDYIRFAYKKNDGSYSEPANLSELNNIILTDTIGAKEEIKYSIVIWIDSEAGNEIMNHYFFGKMIISQITTYNEALLNGADPVLTSNLVPVQIAEDGTVTKANISQEWYNYENKEWANAVVLKDSSIAYLDNQEIPESNIESYFVWIPRYKYKIFDTGSYTELTSTNSNEKEIEIVFENNETTPSTGTAVNDYLTHPAFTNFDTNGLWIGKFETGYDGANSTETAQVNSNDSSKAIIKPNVYSWRNITVGNMFDTSYNYLRSDESHMMKNTEWGAVAYLSHSIYGTCEEVGGTITCSEVRINNNSSYITGYAATEEPTVGYNGGTSIDGNIVENTSLAIDGTYTINYLNSLSNVASTTGNKTGIYDMSGGTWEYVIGYTTGTTTVGGSSEITTLYSDFFTNSDWDKYYDKYTSTTIHDYDNRILGDSTGEMGPFGTQVDPDEKTRYKSSWYGDYANFTSSYNPWSRRGGYWGNGTSSGVFAFHNSTGGTRTDTSFRIVLAP